MGSLEKLESTLDDVLNKKAPFKIPPEGRKALAHALWWIALVVGVLQLWVAVRFWQWGHAVDQFVNTLNYYTGGNYSRHLGLFYYVSLIAMAAVAVLMLIAAPSLKALKKTGWNLLFYGVLIGAVAAVVQLFADGGGFGNFLGSAIGTVIGAYLLFQARDAFIMSHPADHQKSDDDHKPAAPAAKAKE